MENNTINQDYVNAMNNLENSIQDGLANIPAVPELPAINPTKKNDIASAVLLGVAGVGTIATIGWVVFGGVKLGKFIKAKAATKKAKANNKDLDEDFEDDFLEDDDIIEEDVEEAK